MTKPSLPITSPDSNPSARPASTYFLSTPASEQPLLLDMPPDMLDALKAQARQGIYTVIMVPNNAANRMSGRTHLVEGHPYCYQAKPLELKLQSSRNPFYRGGIPGDYNEGRKDRADVAELRTKDSYDKKIKNLTEPEAGVPKKNYRLQNIEYSEKELLRGLNRGDLQVISFDGNKLVMTYKEDDAVPKKQYHVKLNSPVEMTNFVIFNEDVNAVPQGLFNEELIAALSDPGDRFYNIYDGSGNSLQELATQDGLPIRSDNDSVIITFPYAEVMNLGPKWMDTPDVLYRRFNTNADNEDERLDQSRCLVELLERYDPNTYNILKNENMAGGSPNQPSNGVSLMGMGNVSVLEVVEIVRLNQVNQAFYPFMRSPMQHGSNSGYSHGKIPFKESIVTGRDGQQQLVQNESQLIALLKEGKIINPSEDHFDINPHWVVRGNGNNDVEVEGWFDIAMQKIEAGMPVFKETVQLMVNDKYFNQNLSADQQSVVRKYVEEHYSVPIPAEPINKNSETLGPYVQDSSNIEGMSFKMPMKAPENSAVDNLKAMMQRRVGEASSKNNNNDDNSNNNKNKM